MKDFALAGKYFKGRANCYTCRKCKGIFTTIDIDEGVTPAFLICRNNDECNGMAVSSFYPDRPIPDNVPSPMYEWYRPDEAEYVDLTAWEAEHVQKDGLLLRKITAVGRDLFLEYYPEARSRPPIEVAPDG